MKLFIADDSKMVCARIITFLSDVKSAEIVGTAYNTAEAIRGISQLQPDVVLIDFRLCGNCSIDVLRLVKQSQSSLRVIILTNYPLSHAPYEKKCIGAGADFLVDKSFDLERIKHLLDDLIQAPHVF